jgi:hypothetical protein
MEMDLKCTMALGGSRAFWASTQAKAKPALGARGLPRSPLPPQAGFGPSLCALARSIPAAGVTNKRIFFFIWAFAPGMPLEFAPHRNPTPNPSDSVFAKFALAPNSAFHGKPSIFLP